MEAGQTAQVSDSCQEVNEVQISQVSTPAGGSFAGTHLIIEVVGGTGLDDEMRVRQALEDCVKACKATLLHLHTHRFHPNGISGVAVLAESHISVHTWPERGYGAFDVFMCGDTDPWASIGILSRAFRTDDVRVRELKRGEGLFGDDADRP